MGDFPDRIPECLVGGLRDPVVSDCLGGVLTLPDVTRLQHIAEERGRRRSKKQ